MRPFGIGGMAYQYGDLSQHIGWIEALASDEEETTTIPDGPKAKRLQKVEDALELLREAAEDDEY